MGIETKYFTTANEPKALGITSASVGQIPKVKAVDSNGAPTEWEPVAMPSGGGTGTSVQSDWNQNDETASDYIKNRPGGYEKQVSINIDVDIVAGMEGLIAAGEDYVYRLPVDNINDFLGAKVGNTQGSIATIDSIIYVEDANSKVELFLGFSGSDIVCYLCVIKEDNTDVGDSIILDKGIYIAVDVGVHLYISNNGTIRYPIDASLLPVKSVSDYIKVSQSKMGVQLDWNLRFGSGLALSKDSNGNPELYATSRIASASTAGTIKVGKGLSISKDGTLSVTTATYYTGTSDPVDTLGADGDLYLQTEG